MDGPGVMEAKAVQIVTDELVSAGGSSPGPSLSVKVKWGQGELGGLGSIRKFLSLYPLIFKLDGTTVTLLKSGGDAPKTTSKSAPKAPPDSLHSNSTEDDAKPASKRGGAPQAPVNPFLVAEADLRRKRRWSDGGNGNDIAAEASPEKSARQTAGVSTFGSAGPSGDGPCWRQDPYQMSKGSSPGVPEPSRPPVVPAKFGAFAGPQSGFVPPPPTEPAAGMAKAPAPPPPRPSSNTGVAAACFLPPDQPPPPKPPGAPPIAPWNVRQPVAPPPPMPPPVHQFNASRQWEDDSLSDAELRQSIVGAKTQGIELELQALAQKLVPQEDYKKDIERALTVLKGAAVQALGTVGAKANSQDAPQLDIIGSSLQGTDIHGSDVDIALRLGPSTQSIEDRDAKVQKVRERLRGSPQSLFFESGEALRHFPHASCQISAKLRGASGAPPKLVVHLVLQHREDVSQARPESLDTAVSRLCGSFEPARSLVRLVKLWTCIHGFSAAHDGYMNGMAWTAFVLCFLQRQKHIKALANLTISAPAASGEEQMPSLTSLLRGFFQFACAPQPKTPWGLSLNEGRDCPAAPPPDYHVGPPPPLYLEDPCAWKIGRRRNLASTLGEAQWSRILEEARRAADKLDDTKPQRWFHWAEIFDPQSLTPTSNPTKRLQKLSEAAAAVVPSQGEQSLPETQGTGSSPAPCLPLTPGSVSTTAPAYAPVAPPPITAW